LVEEQRPKKEKIIEPKLIIWLVALLAIWVLFITIIPLEYRPTPSSQEVSISFKAFAGDSILDQTISVKTGTNAFEAMQQVATVEFTDYGEMGVLVETINGFAPSENEFWKLFVNGEESALGISSIIITEDIEIEWRTESIESYMS